jgi:hypothetical protein
MTLTHYAPQKIIEDLSNNTSYWLYTNDTATTASNFQYVAELNSFDFHNNVNENIVKSSEFSDNLINAMTAVGASGTIEIFIRLNNESYVIYFSAPGGGGGAKKITLTHGGGAPQLQDYDTSITVLAGARTSKYAIVMKQNQDKSDDYVILEKQIRNNVIISKNQHVALQYIYIFLILISILGLLFNFQNVRLMHIIFLLLFIGYGFVYQNISMFIISQFKQVIQKMQVSDSTTQLMLYIKMVLLALLAFSLPLLSMLSFNPSYDMPISEVADLGQSSMNDAIDYGNDLVDNIKENTQEAADAFKERISDARDAVTDVTDNVRENISNVTDSVTNLKDNIVDRFSSEDASQLNKNK